MLKKAGKISCRFPNT